MSSDGVTYPGDALAKIGSNALDAGVIFEITRSGAPKKTIANVALLLGELGDQIRYEEFAGKIVVSGMAGALGLPDGPWTDEHTIALVIACEKEDLEIRPDAARAAVRLHAKQRSYNVLTNFAIDCAAAWDGVARVDQALATYWGAPDTDATRIASRVFFLSLAARALEPGCKVDTCVTFVGGQGRFKSTSFRKLVSAAWFSDSPLPIGDKDAMQNLRGKWLWEFSENESLSRKERNAVKAYLSSQADDYRASYGHNAERVPRQTCFVASTNEPEFLTDPTGNRRFPIVVVGRIDLDAIERDRLQLIGEAVTRVGQDERWWPDAADDRVLDAVRAEHEEPDPWEAPIATWLAARRDPCDPFTIGDVLFGALQVVKANHDKRAQARVAAVLRRAGCAKHRPKSGPIRDQRMWLVGPRA